MMSISHRSKAVLIAIILLSATIALLHFNSFQIGAYSDDAHYIVLAESIAHGRGYRLINFPNAPVERAFPPGWPLLLSSLVAFFPKNYAVLKLLSFVFWLASIPLTYRLFSKRLGTPYLEVLTALVALNPTMVGISGMVMSESAYLFFSLLTLNLFDLWNNSNNRLKGWLLVAVTGIAFYTQLIRTVGMSVLLAIILYLLLSRRYRQLTTAASVIATGMIFQFWFNSQNGGSLISPGYQAQVFSSSLTDKVLQVLVNFQTYLDKMVANSVVPIFGPKVTSVLGNLGLGIAPLLLNAFILFLIVIGLAISLQHFQLDDLYVGLYFLGILSFWNPAVGSAQMRFLIPIVPFLYFYLLKAIQWLAHSTLGKSTLRASRVVTGLAFLIILLLLIRDVQGWLNPIRDRMTDLSVGTDWVSENTPSISIIMTRDPVPDYLYARRKTIAYPPNDQDVREYISANGVDYVIVSPKLQTPRSNQLDDLAKTHLLPALMSDVNRYRVVFTNAPHNVTVYAVRSEKQ